VARGCGYESGPRKRVRRKETRRRRARRFDREITKRTQFGRGALIGSAMHEERRAQGALYIGSTCIRSTTP
jgi:hypothetical protein